MIDQKDWVAFTAMLDLEQKVEEARIEQKLKNHFKKQDEMREVMEKILGETAQLVPMSFVPYFPTVRRTYPRTVEGCMDWIAAGRPMFAKKIKVKSK